jgi:hypothetical protein
MRIHCQSAAALAAVLAAFALLAMAAGATLAAGPGHRSGGRPDRQPKCAKTTARDGQRAHGRRSCGKGSGRRPPVVGLPKQLAPASALSPVRGTDPAPTAPSASPPPIGAPPPPLAAPESETADPPPVVQAEGPMRFFSPTSPWNEEVTDAPLDPRSVEFVGAFEAEVRHELASGAGPSISTHSYSVPIYTVSATEPTVPVALASTFSASPLRDAFDAVPLPAGARAAGGSDGHLVVWQPSTDRLWEFVGLVNGAGSWQAFWGGAMQNVSSNPGAYGPEAWPGAQPSWGASACSLSIAGGLITLEDLELGQINHALAIAIPRPRAGVYASPARRTDGYSSEPLSLPEGAHLRLDPNLDLAALHLPPLTLMMAEAAQRYGILVRDVAANVTFYAQDPTPTGTNPYTGANGYFEGKSPRQLLQPFPWSHLQLLKMELHSTG